MSTTSWSVTVDRSADAAYIRMSEEPIVATEEASDDVLVDLDKHRMVVGIEMLRIDAPIPFAALTTGFHVPSDLIERLRGLLPSIQARLEIAADGVSAMHTNDARLETSGVTL